jgi:hypothetical protein
MTVREIYPLPGFSYAGTTMRTFATTSLSFRSPLNPVPSGFLAIPLGRTTRSGGSGAIQYDGTVSVPFRDGRHIERDADKLKLPAFAIAGDVVTEINNPASSHHY